MMRRLLDLEPENPGLRAALGDMLAIQQEFTAAEEQYAMIVDQFPGIPGGYIKLAQLHTRQGGPNKTETILKRGYATNPDNTTLLSALVDFYIRQGNTGRALQICTARLDKRPDEVFTHALMGKIYESQGNYPKSETAYTAAIDLQPAWQLPHNRLARLYLIQGQTKQAVERLENAIAEDATNIAAHLTLAALYVATQDYDNACRVYEDALEVNPTLWIAANNLAFLISEYSDGDSGLDKALELAKKANDLRPEDPAILDSLGWIYFKKGEVETAQDLIEKAVGKAPENAVLNYHLGMVLYTEGFSKPQRNSRNRSHRRSHLSADRRRK